jgi:CheY-like chemotaxis protein
MTIGVLIADDQTLVRTGFRMILDAEEDLRVVGEAKDGTDAVEAARRSRPDVVLMDIRMPRMDGLEATRRIVGGSGGPKVLMLTTFDLDESVFDALRAGASDGPWPLQRRDRRRADRLRDDGQDTRGSGPVEAGVARPRSGGGARLRDRDRHPWGRELSAPAGRVK